MTGAPPEEQPRLGTPPDDPGDTDEVEVDEVDEAGEESFPASDAPEGWSGPPGT